MSQTETLIQRDTHQEIHKEILDNIQKLKKERDAIILAHNYTLPEIQDAADFIGDSFELSKKAAKVSQQVILFCGVRFMGETAKILSPEKTVLMPDFDAGCPMADMVTTERIAALRKKHPGAKVVCYVNSSAEVKAVSDICCTSSSALRIVKQIPEETPVIFIPDKNLGNWVAEELNRTLILINGFCPIHEDLTVEMLLDVKEQHPHAKIILHPECPPDTLKYADEILSTGGMRDFIKTAPPGEYIIGTETGMIYPLGKIGAGVKLYEASDQILCPNMKKNSIEKVEAALVHMQYEITLDPAVMDRARIALERMLNS